MDAPNFRNSQRGYTLMEILVAVAIFATVMIVALLLYDQSNRVFKQSNESAEMQQNTRVAFEKVAADLRMAGFDYKRGGTPTSGAPSAWAPDRDYSYGAVVTPKTPNGHVYRAIKAGTSDADEPVWPTKPGEKVTDNDIEWQEYGSGVFEQPDEQIEYAHSAAVTIRANFDYEDPTTPDNGREQDLESGFFPVVTTGNDEIVTYALVSRAPSATNPDTITFYADVTKGSKAHRNSYPGGDVEDLVEIKGVDLSNNNPPYTLMRYTVGPDGKTTGTALADNIRSMTFEYWEDAAAKIPLRDILGNKITDFKTLGGFGQYDPAKSGTLINERLVRGKIRAVTATIVGMSPQPDFAYKHPTDTKAANYRQYSLQSTIVGRNLGLRGMPQSDTNPPPAPILGASCTGWCGVVLLTWSPGPGTGDVTYTVLYDTSSTGSFSSVLPAGTQTSYAVDLTQFDMSKTYYFRVAATNAAGTTVSAGAPLVVDARNATKPSPPTVNGVTGIDEKTGADTRLPNRIELTFTPPTKFAVGALSCGGTDGYPVEIKGYRILRSETKGFDVNDAKQYTVVANESSTFTSSGTGTLTFVDTNVANCVPYYYRIATVEWCHANAEYNASKDVQQGISDYSAEVVEGSSKAVAPPKMPTSFKQTVESVCDDTTNRCDPVGLTWDKVLKDTAGNDIVVKEYEVYRQQRLSGLTIGAPQYVGTATDGKTTLTDAATPMPAYEPVSGKRYTYEYSLYAMSECDPPNNKSAAATFVYPTNCVTGAQVKPDGDGPGSGTPDDPMQNVNSLTIVPHMSKPFESVFVAVDGPPYTDMAGNYTFDWDIQDGEVHRVSFRVKTADCTEIINFFVQADSADCAIRAAASNVPNQPNQVQLVLANESGEDIVMSEVAITWAGQSGYTWETVKFPNTATPVQATTQGSETKDSPRTVVFPLNGNDKNLGAGKTYTMLLNFSGSTFANAGRVTGFHVEYQQGKATTQFGCDPAVARCAVTSTVTVSGSLVNIELTNALDQPLDVSKLSLRWAGQFEWEWTGMTITAFEDFADVNGPVTKTFTPSGLQIPAEGSITITMHMQPKKQSTPALQPATVTDIGLEFTTPLSGTTLTCRVK